MKDPQIEFAMRLHQLALISERLQKYYEDDSNKQAQINNANSLLSKGNINSASYILQVKQQQYFSNQFFLKFFFPKIFAEKKLNFSLENYLRENS